MIMRETENFQLKIILPCLISRRIHARKVVTNIWSLSQAIETRKAGNFFFLFQLNNYEEED